MHFNSYEEARKHNPWASDIYPYWDYGQFVYSGNDQVTDERTGHIWYSGKEWESMAWDEAIATAGKVPLLNIQTLTAGIGEPFEWRVPSEEELLSLNFSLQGSGERYVHPDSKAGARRTEFFPHMQPTYYWSRDESVDSGSKFIDFHPDTVGVSGHAPRDYHCCLRLILGRRSLTIPGL